MLHLAAKKRRPPVAAEFPELAEDVAPVVAAPVPNPYTNARRAWNDHVGGVVSSRDFARIIAVACLLIALLAVGGTIHTGLQSKFVPYVVEVDKLGRTAAVSVADRAATPDARVVKAALSEWFECARMVSVDGVVQRKCIFKIYALLAENEPATAKMNEWLNSSDDASPFIRAQKELVSIEIDTVIPESESTWHVEWTETERDRQGVLKKKFRMKALAMVYFVAPTPQTTEEQLRMNPAGVYVRDYSWSKQN